MKTLELKALDTLFFKDGKPFSMGEEAWAQGVFPPYPSVIFGALNSIFLADGANLKKLDGVTKADDLNTGLIVSGYLPALNSEPTFPVPCDMYALKGSLNGRGNILNCIKKPRELISDYDCEYLLQTAQTVKAEELQGKAVLDLDNFNQWLKDDVSEISIHLLNQYLTDEPKVGIGRDFNTRTTTTTKGLLYRVAMKRLHGKTGKLSFIVKYSGFDLTNGISRFGAENKAIEYIKTDFPDVPCLVTTNDKCFKIYMATPAVFEEGYYPKLWFQENGLNLLAAAIGRVHHIGGFDIIARKPKPMHKAVPAGTVYYVEITDPSKATGIQNKLHGRSIYNLAPEENAYKIQYQKQGFGLTYIGKLNLKIQ